MTIDVIEMARRASAAVGARSPGTKVSDVRPLAGGHSSLTYSAVTSAGNRVVVKVAPPGLPPVRNRDVLRQARILDVLASSAVKVPRVLGTDAGDPPLFVMSMAEGESYEPLLSRSETTATREEIANRALAAAAMLSALHAEDAQGVDEDALSLDTELERWAKAFSTVDDDVRDGADECLSRLQKAVPDEMPASIVHGDWRLGNMLCVGDRIEAVIDWEIWSVGDPRIDVAWFLLLADPLHPRCIRTDSGMPAVKHLHHAYAKAAGRHLPDMKWFGALVRYKQAAASALIVKNARKKDPGAPASAAVAELLRQAVDYLD
ncbi:MAG: phosphotransferase family protein [Actinomycetota bacterium]|nr:phosphotransferase family protein [Actinomycetota bacterium]